MRDSSSPPLQPSRSHLVPAALAGGWATVQLSSTPQGIHAGEVWDVRLTVLQHGRTPLVGVTPAVQIASGRRSHTFAARPTATTGVYRARESSSRPPAAGAGRSMTDSGGSTPISPFASRGADEARQRSGCAARERMLGNLLASGQSRR